ncbi:Nuclear prelamin A recognition factor [Myotis davidii]|uniref:Nuclear prelamin A recognition factor n=1 Tax=Myotis davidii TaxID=225400 RepID=L5MIR9_MYODS|nr:Nuclear prelamin A recognition factor [Myotis davidii]
MLTSACPGWDRYAERVLHHPITPHLCTANRPQKIMGSLVKDYFTRWQNLSPDKIFHVIVAPCYEKNWRPFEMFPQLCRVPRVLTVC